MSPQSASSRCRQRESQVRSPFRRRRHLTRLGSPDWREGSRKPSRQATCICGASRQIELVGSRLSTARHFGVICSSDGTAVLCCVDDVFAQDFVPESYVGDVDAPGSENSGSVRTEALWGEERELFAWLDCQAFPLLFNHLSIQPTHHRS